MIDDSNQMFTISWPTEEEITIPIQILSIDEVSDGFIITAKPISSISKFEIESNDYFIPKENEKGEIIYYSVNTKKEISEDFKDFVDDKPYTIERIDLEGVKGLIKALDITNSKGISKIYPCTGHEFEGEEYKKE